MILQRVTHDHDLLLLPHHCLSSHKLLLALRSLHRFLTATLLLLILADGVPQQTQTVLSEE